MIKIAQKSAPTRRTFLQHLHITIYALYKEKQMKKIILYILIFITYSINCNDVTWEKITILNSDHTSKFFYYNPTAPLLCPTPKSTNKCASVLYKTYTALKIQTKEAILNYVLNTKHTHYTKIQESKLFNETAPKKIAVLYIATGRYIRFWENFHKSAEKYFLPRHQKTYFLFTDSNDIKLPKNVVKVYQKQEPWPYITLKRYHFFNTITDQLKHFDYIYFLNANMIFKQEVTEEIFPTKNQEFMVTLHPGYYRCHFNKLPYERNIKSKAYIPYNSGKYYVMGGFNGGTAEGFLKLSKQIQEWTDADLNNNIIPAWHDESMLNRYLLTRTDEGFRPLILLPEYGIPEIGHSNMNEFHPHAKIIILGKEKYGGHEWLRGEK